LAMLVAYGCGSLNAGCYYTDNAVCLPAGTVISSSPVQCNWGSGSATLYDQDFTEQNAYKPIAKDVNPQHTNGHTQKVAAIGVNMVSVGTTRVKPNCDVVITSGVYNIQVNCQGDAADDNSPVCYLVMINIETLPPIADSHKMEDTNNSLLAMNKHIVLKDGFWMDELRREKIVAGVSEISSAIDCDIQFQKGRVKIRFPKHRSLNYYGICACEKPFIGAGEYV